VVGRVLFPTRRRPNDLSGDNDSENTFWICREVYLHMRLTNSRFRFYRLELTKNNCIWQIVTFRFFFQFSSTVFKEIDDVGESIRNRLCYVFKSVFRNQNIISKNEPGLNGIGIILPATRVTDRDGKSPLPIPLILIIIIILIVCAWVITCLIHGEPHSTHVLSCSTAAGATSSRWFSKPGMAWIHGTDDDTKISSLQCYTYLPTRMLFYKK